MLIGKFDGIEIHRKEKIIYVNFLVQHRVISTCSVSGGLRDDLEGIANHQLCEPLGHNRKALLSIDKSPFAYLKSVCEKYGLNPQKTALLGTAANMNYAAIESQEYRGLQVVAISTGGVETNAGRAGDPANLYEKDGTFMSTQGQVDEPRGTINTILIINKELTHGAMVRSIVTASEAKAAALQELDVNSRYSCGQATGTGTDQVGIASRLTGEIPLTGAGKHTKLGELIGVTVKKSVKNTLALQDSLTPQSQRSATICLERFGIDKKSMKEQICSYLNKEVSKLFEKNFVPINRDSVTVAATSALVHLRDKIEWGILPENCLPEIFSSYGAQLSASISGKFERIDHYREALSREQMGICNHTFTNFICKSFALGFNEKWE
ncbi:MAG: adenosylcobinamide amidohydrolase [Candidatus Scalindua sp. AMX11]|nr:MAG: adenosylcobinamide amidohydrolase [Candidatus Scalindua sp.]NOG84483.1 adenosylcobinamide amidohydrolase [Planctomycetota bacterium]RZV80508.1 MAG: adenosylcobinamide amidohydrolase [Candidatus Scalindua sp. SCAELEC01]TDE65275.1 MAG: adenosylcobinamide amidohydrolase [Candidatus Scalindua sp. AMX11]GJQ58484.1 MAG: adenosylcobinamide amidohydrolase [Candidatus Scalindua sp.]